ncbi:MAG: hypothetical protein U0031_03585 [Thermomicrobiales bacterium]
MATTTDGHGAEPLLSEPEFAELLPLLRARDDAPGPDPVFAARLLDDLQTRIASTQRGDPTATSARIVRLQGHLLQDQPAVPAALRALPAGAQGWWHSARRVGVYAATVALILVTVLAGSLAGPGQHGWGWISARLPLAHNLETLPAATLDPTTAQGLLTQMTAPTVPAAADFVSIERWQFAAGEDPAVLVGRSGPTIVLVIEGQLSVTLDQPGSVSRGVGRHQPESFGAGRAETVDAGDALLIPGGVTATMNAAPAGPVEAIFATVLADTAHDMQSTGDAEDHASIETLGSTKGARFAPGPARLELSRATLQPGETMAPPDDGVLRLVATETMYLGYLRHSPDGSVTNLEKAPLGVLVLTVDQPYPNLTAETGS